MPVKSSDERDVDLAGQSLGISGLNKTAPRFSPMHGDRSSRSVRRSMRRVLQLVALFALAGQVLSAAGTPPFAHERLGVADGCFVESVAFYDAVRERLGADAWCRILQWGAREDDEIVAGHAVAVLEHQRRLWIWDVNYGWMPSAVSPTQREDAATVAAPVTAKYPRIEARHPLYRHDFPQTAGRVGASDPPGVSSGALRDAAAQCGIDLDKPLP